MGLRECNHFTKDGDYAIKIDKVPEIIFNPQKDDTSVFISAKLL